MRIIFKKELKFIKEKNGSIQIGAGITLIEFEQFIKKYYPDFNSILKRYGSFLTLKSLIDSF